MSAFHSHSAKICSTALTVSHCSYLPRAPPISTKNCSPPLAPLRWLHTAPQSLTKLSTVRISTTPHTHHSSATLPSYCLAIPLLPMLYITTPFPLPLYCQGSDSLCLPRLFSGPSDSSTSSDSLMFRLGRYGQKNRRGLHIPQSVNKHERIDKTIFSFHNSPYCVFIGYCPADSINELFFGEFCLGEMFR